MNAWTNDATAEVAAWLAGDSALRQAVIGRLRELASADSWDQDVLVAAATVRDVVAARQTSGPMTVAEDARRHVPLDEVAWSELGESMLLIVLRDQPSIR